MLCGADVSIVIFSAAGKAFEFSSKELDGELDRYLDVSSFSCSTVRAATLTLWRTQYEGVIERRRAPEFAAMAEADEDDDDDDDDGRRGFTANGKPGGVSKSLKGKESFKARMHSQTELAKIIARREKERDRDRHRSRDKVRSRDAEYGRKGKGSAKRSTVDVGDDESESSDGSVSEDAGDKRRRRDGGGSRTHRDSVCLS